MRGFKQLVTHNPKELGKKGAGGGGSGEGEGV